MSVANPASSLLMLKATGQVAHEGGARFGAGGAPAKVLTTWMAAGCRDDRGAEPTALHLDVRGGTLTTPTTDLKTFAEFADAPGAT